MVLRHGAYAMVLRHGAYAMVLRHGAYAMVLRNATFYTLTKLFKETFTLFGRAYAPYRRIINNTFNFLLIFSLFSLFDFIF